MKIHRAARMRPITLSAGLLALLAGGCSQWPATGYAPAPAEDSEIRAGLWESRFPDGERPPVEGGMTTAWWRTNRAAPQAAPTGAPRGAAPAHRTVSITPGAAAPTITESRPGVAPKFRRGTQASAVNPAATHAEPLAARSSGPAPTPTFYSGQRPTGASAAANRTPAPSPVAPTTRTAWAADRSPDVTPAVPAARVTTPTAVEAPASVRPTGTASHGSNRGTPAPHSTVARTTDTEPRRPVPPLRFVVARDGAGAAREPAARERAVHEPAWSAAAAPGAPIPEDAWPTPEPLAFSTGGAGTIVPQPGGEPAGWHHDPRPPTATGPHGVLNVPADAGAGPHENDANVSQVSFALEGADFDPDVSRDGRFLVFASTQHQPNADVYIKSVGNRVVTQLTSDAAQDLMPKFSPDGTRVAFASNRGGNWDLYVMPTAGGNPIQVTSTPSHELHPSWSPDGTQLVYCRLGDVSGQWELWVTDAANSGVSHFLGYGLFPEWCPTRATGEGGTDKILVQRSRQRGDRAFSVWTIDYRDGRASNPTEVAASATAACINPAWSPDGRWIVFAEVPNPSRWDAIGSGRPPSAELWLADLNGGARVKLTGGPALALMPAWGPQGRVFFVSDRGGVDNIWALNATESVRLAAGMGLPQNVANAPEGEGGDH